MAEQSADDDLEIVDPDPEPDRSRGWTGLDDELRDGASAKGPSPRRIVTVVAASVVGLVALGLVAVARGNDPASTPPGATIDLGSSAEADGAQETVGETVPEFGSKVLVTGDDGAQLVDLDQGTSQRVTGLPRESIRLVADWAGAALVADERDDLFFVPAGASAATPIHATHAFVDSANTVWLIDDSGVESVGTFRGVPNTWVRPGPSPVPLPEQTTPIAGLDQKLVLRNRSGDLVAFEPGSGTAAFVADADDPLVLATGANRVAWTDGTCEPGNECTVFVTDADTRVTASIEAGRTVAHAALTTSGGRLALFDGAGWYAEHAVASEEDPQWRSLGTTDTVSATYRPGDTRLLVLASSPPRVLALSHDGSDQFEQELPAAASGIAWSGPSSAGGPSWNARNVTAAPIDGRRPPLLLGEPSEVEVAFVDDGGRAQVLNLDTGKTRFLDPSDGGDASAVPGDAYASAWVGGGALISYERGSWWYPPGGEPIRLEREWTLQDPTAGTALAVDYGSGTEPLGLRLFDPAAGAFVESGDPVHLFPVALLGRSVLFEQPPALHEASAGLMSLDLDTSEERLIPSPEPGAYVLTAGAGHIVWQRGSEACPVGDCPVVVTDALGEVQHEFDSGLVRLAALSPDGTSLALAPAGSDSAPVVIDLVTGSVRELAPLGAVFGVDWSTSGWLLMSSGVAITGETELSALPPGATEVISLQGLRITGALAAR